MTAQKLKAVYLQTDYIVEVADKTEITLRIGERNEQFEDWLRERGAKCWAFVTACNPRSEKLAAAENLRRQVELLKILEPFRIFPARGAFADWVEPSILILDIKRRRAIEIARLFEQNAIVYGFINKPPALVWCE